MPTTRVAARRRMRPGGSPHPMEHRPRHSGREATPNPLVRDPSRRPSLEHRPGVCFQACATNWCGEGRAETRRSPSPTAARWVTLSRVTGCPSTVSCCRARCCRPIVGARGVGRRRRRVRAWERAEHRLRPTARAPSGIWTVRAPAPSGLATTCRPADPILDGPDRPLYEAGGMLLFRRKKLSGS
jgi:hypothetical protein